MFIGHINQALSRKLKSKYRRKLVIISQVEKYKQHGENSCANKSFGTETSNESDDNVPLAQMQKFMRTNKTHLRLKINRMTISHLLICK